jgi:hypothetical protein
LGSKVEVKLAAFQYTGMSPAIVMGGMGSPSVYARKGECQVLPRLGVADEQVRENKAPTSGLKPPTCSSYEFA